MERQADLKDKFLVGFHGKFIPLQGVPYIVKAAKILENDPEIHFQIIGNGQTYAESFALSRELNLKNLDFLGKVSFEELPSYLRNFDVCLGIFGNTPKTLRVIPNKVYESIAMAKPVISAFSPAMEEIFVDKENILFCQTANPQDLAEKILSLKQNAELRETIAQGGYKLFQEKATPKVIVKQLLEDLNQGL